MKMETPVHMSSYSAPSSPRKYFAHGANTLDHRNSENSLVGKNDAAAKTASFSQTNPTSTSIPPTYIRKGNKLIRMNEDNSQESSVVQSTVYSPSSDTTAQTKQYSEKPQAQVPVSRHRTLVVQSASNLSEGTNNTDTQPSGWVQKRSRHMQLINAAVHAKRTADFKKSRPNIISLTPKGTSVLIDGTKYRRGPSGNKLVIAKEGVSGNEVTVGGVVFVMDPSGQKLIRKKQDTQSKRTRSGNLMILHNAALQQHKSRRHLTKRSVIPSARSKYCQYFNRFGRCSKGSKCPYIHDPKRVAICTKFLRGACEKPEECPFSHNITPERVPLCYHFQKGKCTNQDCPYLHVKVNPDAPVCKAFLTEGYCPNGKSCKERHVWECPDFSATGICENSKCKLPHVARGHKRNSSQLSDDSVESHEDEETPREAEYQIQPNFTNAPRFSSPQRDTEVAQEREESCISGEFR
ncbi:hypothetical protein K493DRAFT_34613 [Basidiobolus meristosporus CBS 931.73]|uniref:C3H1-type domain-containing protein n=1 Tax=Basidiobolus meristosporus CBS 931.73 TaxID=1314790 RepID=A0A1Y1Y6V5_9FUNG|nr:hypothetical protein K493DRAFT_34613 [Basidiobolus meristosporus CBS 931.73]|eukprot:ORX93742.1 hypothetical protein K493DRAFT_34613 [Basidiobolus meristosporus CBS 931.73]